MSESPHKVEADRQLISAARQRGLRATLATYTKLSGPGWLQSAVTLGGGSLAGSLYLGVIAGYQLLWLQPLMMILGVSMLGAIGYVALSTNERPFESINRHINPVLGWGLGDRDIDGQSCLGHASVLARNGGFATEPVAWCVW